MEERRINYSSNISGTVNAVGLTASCVASPFFEIARPIPAVYYGLSAIITTIGIMRDLLRLKMLIQDESLKKLVNRPSVMQLGTFMGVLSDFFYALSSPLKFISNWVPVISQYSAKISPALPGIIGAIIGVKALTIIGFTGTGLGLAGAIAWNASNAITLACNIFDAYKEKNAERKELATEQVMITSLKLLASLLFLGASVMFTLKLCAAPLVAPAIPFLTVAITIATVTGGLLFLYCHFKQQSFNKKKATFNKRQGSIHKTYKGLFFDSKTDNEEKATESSKKSMA